MALESRVEGRAKVTGAAHYSGDLELPQVAHAVIVGATIAKGRLIDIDTVAAAEAPGVVTVITPRNTLRLKAPSSASGVQPSEAPFALQSDTVTYAGQPMAVVVAESLEQGLFAASLVKTRYATEAAFLSLDQADAPVTYPAARFGVPLQKGWGDLGAAMAAPGAVTVDETYETPCEVHNPMEPHATLAAWDGDQLTLYHSTQYIDGTQQSLAAAFNVDVKNVRVVCRMVGGAFGSKGTTWQPCMLAALAARQVGRPVRLVLRRQEMFDLVGHRSTTIQRVRVAATQQGKLLGLSHDVQSYRSELQEFVEPCSLMTRVLYETPVLGVSHRLAKLNLPSPTFMRAPGEASGSFALESAMDELAYKLGADPLQLRLACYADKDPGTGKLWSSKHLKECYARGAQRFGWTERRAAPRSMRRAGRLVGWGVASATYPGNRQPASARVTIDDTGAVAAASATCDIGQGNYTVMTQITAEALGVDAPHVRFEMGSSDLPSAPITAGSMTAASVGSAVAQAAGDLRAKLLAMAKADQESPLSGLSADQIAVAGGRLTSREDPGRVDTYAALLQRARLETLQAEATTQLAVRGEAKDQECRGGQADDTACYAFHSFGAQFAEVEVDPDTMEVRVTRFVGAFDVGLVLNPTMARSQGLGAITMGIGMALMEEGVRDPRNGRIVTRNLADYHVPVNADVPAAPDIEVMYIDRPDPHFNVLGCRGLAELPIVGVAAAVTNAVFHATGKRVRALPVTPDKLL